MVQRMRVEIALWGVLADWLYDTINNLPRQDSFPYNGGINHQVVGTISCAPYLHLKQYPEKKEKHVLWQHDTPETVESENKIVFGLFF